MTWQEGLYREVEIVYSDETRACYRLALNPRSEIYRAHFPGEPITPGACIIGMVLDVAARWQGKTLTLAHIGNLKYLSVISPEETELIDVEVSLKEITPNALVIRAEVRSVDKIFTKMTLSLHLQAEQESGADLK